MRKIIPKVLLLLFLLGAAIAGYNIFRITSEYKASEDTYAEVQQYIQLPAAPSAAEEAADPSGSLPAETESTAETAAPTEAPQESIVYPEVDFDSLLAVNKDVVAWIYVEDTKINYPVLQGDDNRYYVSTLIDGRDNSAGSIFMDYRNHADLSDRHTILYGHNMKNGTMFADICSYRTQEYYDAHPIGLIMTPEQNYCFDIVAGYVASLADPAWQLEFVSDEDALQWLEDSIARSSFTSRVQPELGDRIITLSTCSYEFNEARFVLVGVIRED